MKASQGFRNTVIAVALLGLAACAHEPLPPDTAMQDLAPDAWKEDVEEITVSNLQWSDFNDSVLTELIDRALANNPDITTSTAALRLAMVGLDESVANRRPDYSIDARAGGVETRNFDFVDDYGLTARASYEIDLWGINKDYVRIAELDLVTAEVGLLTTRISLAAEVTNAYYDLRVLDQRLRLQRETLDYTLKQQQYIEARHKAGLISGIDVNNQEVEVQRLYATIEDRKADRSLAEQRLAILVGEAPQRFDFTATDSVTLPRFLLEPDTPADVLRSRPDIQASEARLQSSYIRFDQARKAFYPTVALSASTGFASGSLSDLIRDSSFGWSIGADIIATLLDNGRRERNVERARINAESSMASYRKTILGALQDVERALTVQETTQRQLDIQQLALAAQERLVRETEAKYRVGAVSGDELVRQQRSLVLQRENHLITRLQGLQATVALLRALGVAPE